MYERMTPLNSDMLGGDPRMMAAQTGFNFVSDVRENKPWVDEIISGLDFSMNLSQIVCTYLCVGLILAI